MPRVVLAAEVAALVLLLSATTAIAAPFLTIAVDRAVQFDRTRVAGSRGAEEVVEHGTRSTLLRGAVMLFNPLAPVASYQHKTVFFSTEEEMTENHFKQLHALPVRGLLLESSPGNAAVVAKVTSQFTIPFPVYFLPTSDGLECDGAHCAPQSNASSLKHALINQNHDSSKYVVVAIGDNAKTVAPSAVARVPSTTFFSSVETRGADGKKLPVRGMTAPPRILLTATIDSLGVAPASNTAGGFSGAATLLDVHRRYAYSGHSSSGALFGFHALWTTGGHFNYDATRSWLSTRPNTELDQYRLVLCLDSLLPARKELGQTATLYLHIQETAMRLPEVQQILDAIHVAANRAGVALENVVEKRNLHQGDLRFEHEVFAMKKVPAITLSSTRSQEEEPIFRNSNGGVVSDDARQLDEEQTQLFVRRACFVHHLSEELLGLPAAGGSFEHCMASSKDYLLGLLEYAAGAARSPVAPDRGSFIQAMEGILQRRSQSSRGSGPHAASAPLVMVDVQHGHSSLARLTLYSPFTETMKVYIASSAWEDAVLLLAAVVIVITFSAVEFGISGLWQVLSLL